MRELLRSAFVQDVVTRATSYILSKCEEKASARHNMERLEMAHSELEFALERTGKLPITDVSLLRRRRFLKRAFEECGDVLHRHRCKILVAQEDHQDHITTDEQQGRRSSFPKRIARAITKSSIAYLFAAGQQDAGSDVRRFEWFADRAGKFVRDVESGCSLRHHTFCSPLLRQLVQGRTLGYEERVKRSRFRKICIWPVRLEERGVEAVLWYQYEDYEVPRDNFQLRFMLRLSESTDVIGIAINCLRYLVFQFKLVAEPAMRELTMLSDFHDICYSYAPPWVGFPESYTLLTQVCRPDPLCCRSANDEHEKSAANTTSSISPLEIFPEEVISISFQCNLPISTSTDDGKIMGGNNKDRIDDWPPHLYLRAGFTPHAVYLWEGLRQSSKTMIENRVGSVEQEVEMVKSKTIDRLVRQPDLVIYTFWQYGHGLAFFQLRTPAIIPCPLEFEYRSKTHRIAKRRR